MELSKKFSIFNTLSLEVVTLNENGEISPPTGNRQDGLSNKIIGDLRKLLANEFSEDDSSVPFALILVLIITIFLVKQNQEKRENL